MTPLSEPSTPQLVSGARLGLESGFAPEPASVETLAAGAPRALARLFGRHQVASFIATVIDFAAMTLLVSVVGANAELGTIVGSALGAVTNFTVGRAWVFRATRGHLFDQAGRYAVVSATSLILNTLGEYVAHERAGMQYLLARVLVAIVVSVLWNFPMQRHFVFASSRPTA